MTVLARKITRAKWTANPNLREDAIAADAVTGDLRTTSNALSFWRCDSASHEDVEHAILAIAATHDRPDKFDIVCVNEREVLQRGLRTNATPGSSPVSSLNKYHVDVEQLDLDRLGVVARLVADAHEADASHRVSKKDVVVLLARAVREHLVELDDLKDDMKARVAENLGRRPKRTLLDRICRWFCGSK